MAAASVIAAAADQRELCWLRTGKVAKKPKLDDPLQLFALVEVIRTLPSGRKVCKVHFHGIAHFRRGHAAPRVAAIVAHKYRRCFRLIWSSNMQLYGFAFFAFYRKVKLAVGASLHK